MIKYGKKLSALLIYSLLIGCSSHWVKPDGSSPLWDLDKCSIQAEIRYPVKNEVLYRTKRDYSYISTCSKKKREKNDGSCYFSLPTWELENDIVDVNRPTRNSFINSCMKMSGWIREYKYF